MHVTIEIHHFHLHFISIWSTVECRSWNMLGVMADWDFETISKLNFAAAAVAAAIPKLLNKNLNPKPSFAEFTLKLHS